MQKNRTETKHTVKDYPVYGLTYAAYVIGCVFLVSVQLLSISFDGS